jgi:GT2 family glycosyltransferase
MTISLIMVTFNRVDQVRKCFTRNINGAGAKYDELVWVDNGSADGMEKLIAESRANIALFNGENLGVSKGYNQAMRCCTSDWICIVGDRNLMPRNWLKMFRSVIKTDEVDSICMYEYPGRMANPSRLFGKAVKIAGWDMIPALQNGSMIFRRSLLKTVGYWREDMGMYGWNDIEWGKRMAHRKVRGFVFKEYGSSHCGDDPHKPYFVDGIPYRQWVNSHRDNPETQAKLQWCEANDYPYFNPFL